MFKRMQSMQMQAVHCFQTIGPDQQLYRAIIAIHNTQLGPALGGCRCLSYPNEQLAFNDAMRLAQGMSYKAALAHLNQGGGKSVLILPSQISLSQIDRSFLFQWFGRCVEQLNGLYITAMDVGTQVSDMDLIAAQTDHVASASNIGDPAESTARGVVAGIRAALSHKFADSSLAGRSFAIQGLGHVGWRIAQQLHEDGGKVVVADMNADVCGKALSEGMKVVPVDDILFQRCDVLIPCALGGVLSDDTVKKLQCEIVAGSANNQLESDGIADQLHQKNILYAPDYVINSGGLIFASLHYYLNGSPFLNEKINKKIDAIYQTLLELFQLADTRKQSVLRVANDLAENILSQKNTENKCSITEPITKPEKKSGKGGGICNVA